MRIFTILAIALSLSGCIHLFGAGGWIASHEIVIGQAALAAGAVAAVENVALDTRAIVQNAVKDTESK